MLEKTFLDSLKTYHHGVKVLIGPTKNTRDPELVVLFWDFGATEDDSKGLGRGCRARLIDRVSEPVEMVNVFIVRHCGVTSTKFVRDITTQPLRGGYFLRRWNAHKVCIMVNNVIFRDILNISLKINVTGAVAGSF